MLVLLEKKAGDKTSDKNDRLFRNFRLKESFLDGCHWYH
jgi:hypothetical protein